MRAHPLTKFRTFVLDAAQWLSRFEPVAVAEHKLQVSASAAQLHTICTLAVAVGARMLEAGKPCCVGSPASPDLEATMIELYGRTRQALPQDIGCVMPEPDFLDSRLDQVWRKMHALDLEPFWHDPCNLGYLYQFLSAAARKEALASIQSANKELTPAHLCSFSQLYTPDWVVNFLLANTVLPQWQGLADYKDRNYLLSCKPATQPLPAEKIDVIDPSCGAGHFLIPAFRLLMKIHQAEGYDAGTAASSILAGNIFGVDMDPVGLWITALGLTVQQLKYNRMAQPVKMHLAHVQSVDDTASGAALMGSLSRDWAGIDEHPLNKRYQAVVMNPPYVGRKLMERSLKKALRSEYPESHQDLCAAFIQRGFELLKPAGRLGAITQSSLLSLPSYGRFRQMLIETENLLAVVELGPGVFPLQSGEKINSMLMVAESGIDTPSPEQPREIPFLDLVKDTDKPQALLDASGKLCRFERPPDCYFAEAGSFSRHNKYALNYRVPPVIQKRIDKVQPLSSLVDVRQGLATSDNDRFVRYWWDVEPSSIGAQFHPYVKGAGSERWHAPCRHVVNWGNNGAAIKEAVTESYPYLHGKTEWVVKNEQFYFQPGLTFSFVNSRGLAVRQLPAGCIFDVGGSALFGRDEDTAWLLAYLNSSFVAAYARMLNPTVNFQVGDLRRLPTIEFDRSTRTRLSEIASLCVGLKREVLQWDESTCESKSQIVSGTSDVESSSNRIRSQINAKLDQIRELESEVNALVLNAVRANWQLSDDDTAVVQRWAEEVIARRPHPQSPIANVDDVICLFIHHWLYSTIEENDLLILPPDHTSLNNVGFPDILAGWFEQNSPLSFIDYLRTRFMERHRKRFQGTPLWYVTPVGSYGATLITSSRALRKPIAANKASFSNSLWSGDNQERFSEAAASAQGLLAELMAAMSLKKDWRGCDLHALSSTR